SCAHILTATMGEVPWCGNDATSRPRQYLWGAARAPTDGLVVGTTDNPELGQRSDDRRQRIEPELGELQPVVVVRPEEILQPAVEQWHPADRRLAGQDCEDEQHLFAHVLKALLAFGPAETQRVDGAERDERAARVRLPTGGVRGLTARLAQCPDVDGVQRGRTGVAGNRIRQGE